MGKIIEVEADAPASVSKEVATGAGLTPPFADGIYFGLDETPYHADPALGSTDIRRLFYSPAEWWWHSGLNPLRPAETESRYKEFGKAVHKIVLEGQPAFAALYEREYDGDDLLVTMDDLKKWLADRGQKCPTRKAEATSLALALDPDVKIADELKRAAEVAGRTILSAADYDRAVISGTLIAQNPGLEQAFQNGMPEVSIFWTEDVDGEPVRCKGRLDYLKVRGIGDLKSTSNSKQMDFPALCRIRFAERRMDMQAVHYMRARSMLPGLVAAGNVFGDYDADWLAKVAEQDEFGFAFVFFQSEGAPSSCAISLSPGNPILNDFGAPHREIALRNFIAGRAEYGADMWLKREQITELDLADLPMWFGRR